MSPHTDMAFRDGGWSPERTAFPGFPDGAVWHPDGWEFAALHSVQPRDGRTRGQAAARWAAEVGCAYTDARVVRRWARALTVAEVWEWYVGEYAEWGGPPDPDIYEGSPPPDGWVPGDDCPLWTFCGPDGRDAVEVWVCRPAHTEAPPRWRSLHHQLTIYGEAVEIDGECNPTATDAAAWEKGTEAARALGLTLTRADIHTLGTLVLRGSQQQRQREGM